MQKEVIEFVIKPVVADTISINEMFYNHIEDLKRTISKDNNAITNYIISKNRNNYNN